MYMQGLIWYVRHPKQLLFGREDKIMDGVELLDILVVFSFKFLWTIDCAAAHVLFCEIAD